MRSGGMQNAEQKNQETYRGRVKESQGKSRKVKESQGKSVEEKFCGAAK
jgi:hypothetical protein